MNSLQTSLIQMLRQIDGLEDRPSPVSGGIALFHRGREFAHFHHANELDLWLTAKVIRAQGLSHPPGSIHHPKRSPNSPWIELRFHDANEIAAIHRLVLLAIAELPTQ